MSDLSLLLESPPPDWAPARFSDVCVRVKEAVSPSADGERLYLGLEHLASGLPALVGRGTESDVRSGKTSFRSGDVLFGKLRPYLRKSALVGEDGICSTDILVFRATEKCLPEFILLLTQTDEFVGHAKATTSGVQHPRTSWSSLREFKLHVPPVPEQKKIAGVVGVVQQGMEQQKRLLALTAELKKAVLHQLFTAGLRGEPQRETEFGPVPKSWNVRTIGELDLEIGDGNYSNKYPKKDEFLTEGVPFIRANNLADSRLVWDDMRHISPELHAQLTKGHLKKNDVCLVTRGSIGEVAFVTDDFVGANINAQLVRLNGGDTIDGKFLYYAFAHPTSQKQFKSLQTGTALQQLPLGKLKFVLIPVPALDEQLEIANILSLIDTKLDAIKRKLNALSDFFRTMLHQLMTAQIRVHELDLSELETATME